MTAIDISAVLVAGGESLRMGADKATLVCRGKPLWEIQLDSLRQLRPVEILVSARTDPPWRPSEVRFVADVPPSRGPLSGLAAALALTRTDHLLALAVDMPLMTSECLEWICNLAEIGRGVVPLIADRPEPLAAVYPVRALVDLERALRGNDFSLRKVVGHLVAAGKLRAVAVPETKTKFFANINQPADLC